MGALGWHDSCKGSLPDTMASLTNDADPFIILVGVDFSDASRAALVHAFAMAGQQPGAEPHVVHVAGLSGARLQLELPDETQLLEVEPASDLLRSFVERELWSYEREYRADFARVVTHLRVGSPGEQIVQLARELAADLVISGSGRRRGFERWVSPSVPEVLMRELDCPVLAVKDSGAAARRRVRSTRRCPSCVRMQELTQGQRNVCDRHLGARGRALLSMH